MPNELSEVETTGVKQATRLIDIAAKMNYEEVVRFNKLLVAITQEIQKFVDQGQLRVPTKH